VSSDGVLRPSEDRLRAVCYYGSSPGLSVFVGEGHEELRTGQATLKALQAATARSSVAWTTRSAGAWSAAACSEASPP